MYKAKLGYIKPTKKKYIKHRDKNIQSIIKWLFNEVVEYDAK